MSKTITFHGPAGAGDMAEFQTVYRAAHDRAADSTPTDRWAMDLTCPDQTPLQAVGMTPRPLTWWGASSRWTDGSATASIDVLPANGFVLVSAWQVDEYVAWDYDRDWSDGTVTPGVKFVSLVVKAPGMTDAEFRDRYRNHEQVAREHHAGCWRYVQNIVRAPVGSPSGQEIHGISELWFRSLEDYVTRLYTSAESPQAVASDTRQFIDFTRTTSTLVRHTAVRS
jgi:hypothetical protein